MTTKTKPPSAADSPSPQALPLAPRANFTVQLYLGGRQQRWLLATRNPKKYTAPTRQDWMYYYALCARVRSKEAPRAENGPQRFNADSIRGFRRILKHQPFENGAWTLTLRTRRLQPGLMSTGPSLRAAWDSLRKKLRQYRIEVLYNSMIKRGKGPDAFYIAAHDLRLGSPTQITWVLTPMLIRLIHASGRRVLPTDIGKPYTILYSGVNTSIGKWLQEMERRRLAMVSMRKVPITLRRHIGVEIECYLRGSRPAVASRVVHHNLQKHVNVGEDGSLNQAPPAGDGEPYRAFEFRILAQEERIQEVLEKLAEGVFRPLEAKVNRTCGLHVHLDFRNGVGRDPERGYFRLVTAQPLLFAMVPSTRRDPKERDGGYCLWTTSPNYARRSSSRYHAINADALHRYSTLEVRLHQGSTNPKKIFNWVTLLRKIADGPTFHKGFPTRLLDLVKPLDLSAEMLEYIRERILEFNHYPVVSYADVPFLDGIPETGPITLPEVAEQMAFPDWAFTEGPLPDVPALEVPAWVPLEVPGPRAGETTR